jgi:hypothetical protein
MNNALRGRAKRMFSAQKTQRITVFRNEVPFFTVMLTKSSKM